MINKAIVEGRLTKDVEVIETQYGKIINFTLVSKQNFKKSNGEVGVDYVNCVAKSPKPCANYLEKYGKKGSLILLEGRNASGSYETKSGQKRYYQNVECDSISINGVSDIESTKKETKQEEIKIIDKAEEPKKIIEKVTTSTIKEEKGMKKRPMDLEEDEGLNISSNDLPF